MYARLLTQIKKLTHHGSGSDGFVLPVVIFAMVIMSTVVVASFVTAGDEHRSSRAVWESSEAFYAAEQGMNLAWASYDDSVVSALAPVQPGEGVERPSNVGVIISKRLFVNR